MIHLQRIMISLIGIASVSIIATSCYMKQPKFGQSPRGKRLELLKQSPNFKDGKFQNIHFTPPVSEGYSMAKITYSFMFKKFSRTRPVDSIPSVKTNLKKINLSENVLVWFGHSSYYIQLNGKRFLIDPVFSGNASPIPNSNKSFKGADVYSAEDMPEIDYLLITHDHYDHLDYPTVMALKPKIKHVVCGLGVGEHFECWKFEDSKVVEKDWNQQVTIADHFTLHTTTSRHFSGRGLSRNNTLWLSFVIETPNLKLFIGGDGGYDTHFAEIGERFGGFDLAILENGQYNLAWHEIHLQPEEVLKAAQDLKAKRLLPLHSSKFKLAFHPWDEPLKTINELNDKNDHLPILTPKIGEVVYLNDTNQVFSKWWKGVR